MFVYFSINSSRNSLRLPLFGDSSLTFGNTFHVVPPRQNSTKGVGGCANNTSSDENWWRQPFNGLGMALLQSARELWRLFNIYTICFGKQTGRLLMRVLTVFHTLGEYWAVDMGDWLLRIKADDRLVFYEFVFGTDLDLIQTVLVLWKIRDVFLDLDQVRVLRLVTWIETCLFIFFG